MAIGTSVPPRAYTREILTTAFNWLQSQPDSVRTQATTPDALVGLYMKSQRGSAFAAAQPGFDAEAPASSQAFMSDLKNLAEGLKEFDDSRGPRAITPPATSRANHGSSPTYPQAPLQTSLQTSLQAPLQTSLQTQSSSMYAVMPPNSLQKQLPLDDGELSMARSDRSEPAQTYAKASAQTFAQAARDQAQAAHAQAKVAQAQAVAHAQAYAAARAQEESAQAPSINGEESARTSASASAESNSTSDLNARSRQMLRDVQFAMNLSSETETLNAMIAIAYKTLQPILI